jgi:hypothetical protein
MSGLANYKPVRMFAEDADDLGVFSALLQDAVAKVGDFAYLPKERRFAFVANRFLWECAAPKGKGAPGRARAGCHFDDVLAARQMRIRADAADAVVELLSIRFEPGADGGGVILLDFAGGGAIRLDVESVNGQLMDLAGPWPTRLTPKHDG